MVKACRQGSQRQRCRAAAERIEPMRCAAGRQPV